MSKVQGIWPKDMPVRPVCLALSSSPLVQAQRTSITPMQDALSDGVPLIVFTGQVATSAIGSDAFQEADVVGISRSCTKWNVMVKSIEELPRRINEAFKIATSGRPGPVLVDLPKDITAGILKTPLPYKATTPGINLGLPVNPLQLDAVSVDLDAH
jgi:acetolactate synthase-1/2/3 large subunit